MKVSLKALIVSSIAISNLSFAAEDKIDYSLSVKSWKNNVEVKNKTGNWPSQDVNSQIIGFTARKGKYFSSISTLVKSSYMFDDAIDRKDVDLSLGYRMNENFSLLSGYKMITVRDHSIANYVTKNNGLYFGVAGFKQLNQEIFAYGNYWNAPKMSNDGTSVTDRVEDFRAQNYEFGFGYAFANNTQLTLGFRNQTMKSNNLTKASSETFVMKGVIVGLNVNY